MANDEYKKYDKIRRVVAEFSLMELLETKNQNKPLTGKIKKFLSELVDSELETMDKILAHSIK